MSAARAVGHQSLSELRAAYRATDYVVFEPRLVIRIDQKSSRLERLLRSSGASEWAFVSAWNPRSRPTAAARNRAQQRRLARQLRAAGFEALAGEGRPRNRSWNPEPSLLVLGLKRSAAVRIARQYGQLAIVVGKLGGPAKLYGVRYFSTLPSDADRAPARGRRRKVGWRST